ncbi:hypothetical protein ISS37_01675 [candidate division KSB1 bacterium]|nr:hypothetical protein [candidate division KSB1 bacterium]
MLEGLRKKLGLRWARIYFKWKVKSDPYNPREVLLNVKKILICLPKDPQLFQIGEGFLYQLKEKFAGAKFIIHGANGFRLRQENLFWGDFFLADRGDFGFFFFPKRILRRRLRAVGCDLAVDCHPDFNWENSFLCGFSGAKLRASLEKKHCGLFFNFIVRINPKNDLQKKYQTILKYLG